MRLVSVEEFAAELNVAVSTVRAKCTSGEWDAIKIGKRWKLDADRVYEKINKAFEERKAKPLVLKEVPADTLIKIRKTRLVEKISCVQ